MPISLMNLGVEPVALTGVSPDNPYDNITASDPLGRWFVFCDSRVEHWKAAAASSHGLFLFGHWGDMVRNFA